MDMKVRATLELIVKIADLAEQVPADCLSPDQKEKHDEMLKTGRLLREFLNETE